MKTNHTIRNFSVAVIFIMAMLQSSIVFGAKPVRIEITGERILQKYKPAEFNGIRVGGDFNVNVYPSDFDSVTIEADKAIVPYIKLEIKDGYLCPTYREGFSVQGNKKYKSPVVNVFCRKIENIKVSGAVVLIMKSEYNGKGKNVMIGASGASDSHLLFANVNQCNIEVSGANDVVLKLRGETTSLMYKASGACDISASTEKVRNLIVEMSGSCDAVWDGVVQYANISCSGASDLVGRNLKANKALLRASGSSEIYMSVADEIEAMASGVGSIYYYGNPQKSQISESGSGDVQRR